MSTGFVPRDMEGAVPHNISGCIGLFLREIGGGLEEVTSVVAVGEAREADPGTGFLSRRIGNEFKPRLFSLLSPTPAVIVVEEEGLKVGLDSLFTGGAWSHNMRGACGLVARETGGRLLEDSLVAGGFDSLFTDGATSHNRGAGVGFVVRETEGGSDEGFDALETTGGASSGDTAGLLSLFTFGGLLSPAKSSESISARILASDCCDARRPGDALGLFVSESSCSKASRGDCFGCCGGEGAELANPPKRSASIC